MKRYALIVAGGSGHRMQSATPKQFMLLQGKPVLMHTLEKFRKYEIVLVLPEAHIPYWKQLCKEYCCEVLHELVSGGATRSESVFRGLQHVPDDAMVAIHDGVRPLLSEDMIKRGFAMAEERGNAIPVVALTDSIRQLTENGSIAVNREDYRLVQTPQIFVASEIKDAYRQCDTAECTDDASVIEMTGNRLHLYEGEARNIKITRPIDILFAETLLC